MKLEEAIALANIGEEYGLKCRLYERYSGRFMFGRETAGVVTESIPDLMAIASENGVKIPKYNQDNMGLDFIIY